MPFMVLKVDVDTCEGTLHGAPKLARVLENHNIPATFLFSVGPDHTGRAIRRVFRPGFLAKASRTSVVQNYGLKTLMYGVLLPGPHIGRRAGNQMRAIAEAGFEVGLHCHDHIRWQDNVAHKPLEWTRREFARGVEAFTEVFGQPPIVHGAAGWQINRHVPGLQLESGIVIASDTRGPEPFMPVVDGHVVPVPQVPTTLPTLDELLGREDTIGNPADYLLELTRKSPTDHVYTLHAELEGGAYSAKFVRLINGWKAQGYEFATLGEFGSQLAPESLPRFEITRGELPGRSGQLAIPGREVNTLQRA